ILDMRQERILLRLVEAMHFVDKQHGALAARQPVFRLRHRLADILHPSQYCRQRNERGIHCLGKNQCESCLAGARRAPENHGMQLVLFDGAAQRLARPDQVALAHILVQRCGPHARGQRLVPGIAGEQVAHSPCRITSAPSGATKAKRLASTLPFRVISRNWMAVCWPSASSRRIISGWLPLKVTSSTSNNGSSASGVSREVTPREERSASSTLNASVTCCGSPPNSSAGVLAMRSPIGFSITCSRSTS